jgi:Sec-independent protein translocase protein TatA
VFEGLFSPWHLLIIAGALFVVLGPDALMRRWHDIGGTVKHLVDDERDELEQPAAVEPPASKPRRPSLAYRLGSRLPRRRRPRRRRPPA